MWTVNPDGSYAVKVYPAPASLALSPASVSGGSVGTVTLNGPAPAGGVSVAVSSSNTGVATVPATMTVPAGQSSATFTITAANVSGATTITATANGVSQSATLTVSAVATAPTVATAAAATPGPVAGKTVALSVLGADAGGEGSLTYAWSTTGTPPAPVTFSASGTNAAKNTAATFAKAGAYTFQVIITNAAGLTAASTVSVTVNATTTTVSVTPPTATVGGGATQPFTASATDQFGAIINPLPGVT